MLFINGIEKTCNEHDWASRDAGINVVDWKYKDKTKLILTTKSQLNELIKSYQVNRQSVSSLKIPFIHILGISAVICYMELHQDGLYKIVQVISFKYPMTRDSIRSGDAKNLIRGLSAFKGLSLNLFNLINDMKTSIELDRKNKMDRRSNDVDSGDDVSSWVRELWFPPNFFEE